MNDFLNDNSNNTEYMVDLSGVTSKEELHDALQRSLPLPDYYGRNLDALFDALTSLPDPCTILFVNVSEARAAIPDYFEKLRQLCRDVQWENRSIQVMFSQR